MFKVGNIYHGFKLSEERKIEELHSIGRIFSHEKTGARLLHLENEDNNKVFSIGFRTPPKDSTGVPHIIEHCVLAGSKKYTTKEPFMDMVKSSLRTFINAMTFPDKTLYPVASRNDKDFSNLMDVYLDAVFFPKIYEIPAIFMQEGWHHEIFNKEDDIIYKGVVYNEMKGSYSSPETILNQAVSKSLLPDTCYSFSSGGDPDCIPDLSREAFLDFHRTLYHPSNSYIFLYGDGDIEKQLAHINDNYLSLFDKINVDSKIKKQKLANKQVELTDYYNISTDESTQNKTYLSMNFYIGEISDLEANLMNDIITQLLIQSEAAPLKKALIEAKIGEDVFSTSGGGLESISGFAAKNANLDKKDEFVNVILSTLRKIVEEGIDKELIKASINVIEYRLREAMGFATKGIIYKILAIEGWLYDKNPIDSLSYNAVIKKLRDKIDSDYFENYIKDKYLNNKNTSIVIIEPKKGLTSDKEALLKEKLREYKNTLTEQQLESLIEENNKLKAMQLADDTEEAKATIPKLLISDVNPQVEEVPLKVISEKGYTVLHHDIFTSKIAYLNLYFDTSCIEEENIPYINLLSILLTKMNTKNKSYIDLSNAVLANTGGIRFSPEVFIKDDQSHELMPKMQVIGKAIGENIKDLMDLIAEIIFETELNEPSRIKNILLQQKSRIEMGMPHRGNSVVASRLASYFSPDSAYQEKLKGLDFYWFLSDLIANFDSQKDEILNKISYVYKNIFNINNLIVSFTGDNEDLELVKDNLHIITNKLSKESIRKIEHKFVTNKLNEGILSNYNVQYVAKGYDFRKLGFDYNGSFIVASTILNGDYLHNRIRAQGGAYGVGLVIEKTGNLIVSSYRDPNLKESILVYDNMASYISNLNLSDEELTQYIIGAIARLEPAMTPLYKGQLEDDRYITGTTHAMVQKIKDEVLATDLNQIKLTSEMLSKAMEEDYVCVLGNENKIKENKDSFINLVKLNK